MKFARKLQNLGTETAFIVSDRATAWAARGNRVFPFHLGDLNLPPPTAIVQAATRAIADGHNGYCPGAGVPHLREQLARLIGSERGLHYEAENVSVQPGGKPVIGKFLASVMNPGDEVLYPVPGFPIYQSQINYQGGVATPYRYRTDANNNFVLDVDSLRTAVSAKTRALIFNNYHNPTGAAATEEEITTVAELAQQHDLWVLADEAYCHIRFDDCPMQSIAAWPQMQQRTVILFTCSKSFAMTGWRLGAAVGPRQAVDAISMFNTNIESCTTHFIQRAVAEALCEYGAPSMIAPLTDELKKRRDCLLGALNDIDGITATPPPSAFYAYIDIAEILRRKNLPDADSLMRKSLEEAGVSFCTGTHFGDSTDTKYIRLAFSGIDSDDIAQGMAVWKRWVETL